MDGNHTLEHCGKVTEDVLRTVFNHFYTQKVMLDGLILKPNMVLPGLTCPKQKALYHRALCNRAARRGEYTADMEKS